MRLGPRLSTRNEEEVEVSGVSPALALPLGETMPAVRLDTNPLTFSCTSSQFASRLPFCWGNAGDNGGGRQFQS